MDGEQVPLSAKPKRVILRKWEGDDRSGPPEEEIDMDFENKTKTTTKKDQPPIVESLNVPD